MFGSGCIFCKICTKEQPAEFLYEDDEVVLFKDIKPVATHHYLSVSKKHIQDVNKLTAEDKPLLEKMLDVGKRILQEKGCNLENSRFGFHCPPFNSVKHLHLHVISPVSELSFLNRGIFAPNTWWFLTADEILRRLESKL